MNILPVPRAKADELDAVISGRRSVSVASPEIARLASVGARVATTFELPAPDPTWQAALRTQLLTAPMEIADAPISRVHALQARLATSARVVMATGTASAMLGTTGVVAAAAESLPGQVLHPVKIATEQARLWLSTGDVGDAHLHLAFARERLDELEAIAGTGTRGEVATTLVDLDTHVAQASAIADATGDEELQTAVAHHLADQAARLDAIAALLPATQQSLVQRSVATVTTLLGGGPGTPAPGPASPSDVPTSPGAPDEPSPTTPEGVLPGLPSDLDPTPSDPDLVPELPGPLDDVGDGLEDVIRDLLDGLSDFTPSEDGGLLDVPLVDDLVDDAGLGDLLGN